MSVVPKSPTKETSEMSKTAQVDTRICSAHDLKAINKKSVGKNYNRTLSDEFFRQLDPDGLSVVYILMTHEHAQGYSVPPHYRCRVLAKMKDTMDPAMVTLDMDVHMYDRLKSVSAAVRGAEVK